MWGLKGNETALLCGGLEATYAVHLRLIRKIVGSRLPISDKLLFASCNVRGATSEYRLEVAIFEGVGHFVPKFHIEEDVPHQPCVHG